MFDLLVIGSGPGGYIAAIRAAELGLKTACIEKRKQLGGTCLNVGCIPSKTLLHASESFWKMKYFSEKQGISINGLSYDFRRMQENKEKVVLGLNQGIEGLFKKNKVTWIQGEASFQDPHTVIVNGQTYKASFIIIATGSEPISLPFLPFDEKTILSSTGALELSSVPKKLLIVGAGVIGVEIGSIYQRLGSQVSFIEFLPRICPTFDPSISKGLQRSLEAQGMIFHLSHQVIRKESSTLIVKHETKELSFSADKILVSIGRKPYTQNLNLPSIGIDLTPKGSIPINTSFQTKQPHIFAIGDLVDGPMLAHKASQEGMAVVEFVAGKSPKIDYLSIPNIVYSYPEAAAVGLTEEEVKELNIPYRQIQIPFKANARARCNQEEEGFVKMIAEKESLRILGIHILSANASELIQEGALAIKQKLKASDLANTSHPHPTFVETIQEAALALLHD